MSENTAAQSAAPQNAQASRRTILLFLALALMSALLNSSAPTPLYPLYQQQFALSSVSLTVVYGAYAAGVLIALFGVGNLAGKVKDLRSMIVPALLVVLSGALLFARADTFAMMLMARLLAGVGTGALTGAANIALVRFGPRDGGKNAALIATLSLPQDWRWARSSAASLCRPVFIPRRCRSFSSWSLPPWLRWA